MGLSHTWTPRLGLDLQGGTTITLTARNSTGTGSVDKTSLELAKSIIQQRVDSLGVGESEVTTTGGNQIQVSVPNMQKDELVQLVGQTGAARVPCRLPGRVDHELPGHRPGDRASRGAGTEQRPADGGHVAAAERGQRPQGPPDLAARVGAVDR